MNLRPHHFLCIQKFTGHGYNEAFTIHMSSVVSELAGKNFEITITEGCDDLCTACPNNICASCNSLEKVEIMDRTVLETCGFHYGDTILWAEAAKKVRERILDTDVFEPVCGSCEWFDLCKSTEIPAVWRKNV